MKRIVLLTVLLLGCNANAKAESTAPTESGETVRIPPLSPNCLQRAEYVNSDLNQLWIFVKDYQRSHAKDNIFTTSDFSKAYVQIMRRMPESADRTRGIYLELRDRYNYMYSQATRYPWGSAAVWNTLELSRRDMYQLRYCYEAATGLDDSVE